MGNKSTLQIVFVLNLIICALAFFQGLYMIIVPGRTYKVIEAVLDKPIEEGFRVLSARDLKP